MVDSFFNALPDYLEMGMRFLPILIMIAVPIAFLIARKKTKNETEKAKKTAGLLGLRYINVAEEMKEDHPKDSLLLNLLSGWSPWAMEGTFNSVPVRVELIVKGRQNRYIPRSDRVSVSNPTTTSYSRGTKYTVSFDKPLPFQIDIHRKISMPFGLERANAPDAVETGDEELDQVLEVFGEDKSGIEKWLKTTDMKYVLKQLYQLAPSINIHKDGLSLYDLYSKANYDHIHNNLRILSEAALKIQNN